MRRDERFAVGQHVLLDIELPSGSILLRSSSPGVVTISVDSSAADAFEIGQMGDNVSVRSTRRGRSARIIADVPTGTDVDVKGASVDLSSQGALGTLRVRASSGDVRADDLVRAEVSLASGDTRVDLVRNDAAVKATSGDVFLRHVGGRLSAILTSGDLFADDVDGDVEIETASGDVTVRSCAGAAIGVRTVSGDIRVGLPSGIRVDPEISTMSGKLLLPEPSPGGSTAQRRPVRVRLRSVSGDIRINRAS